MAISFKEATKRILICGAWDVQHVLPKYNVGMVFITKPYLNGVDYKGLPTHECYIPSHKNKKYEPKTDRNNFDIEVATTFLENNPDKDLLVHCNAGVGVSPSFVFMLLVRLQGDKPDLDEAIKTIHKMTIDAMLDIVDYEPYLPINLQEAKKYQADHALARSIYYRHRDMGSFQKAFDEVSKHHPQLVVEDTLTLCRRFGFHVEQGPRQPDTSGINNAQCMNFIQLLA